MFHQANLRVTDVFDTTLNGVTKQRSLLQMWVETVVTEFNRLVNWPMITKPHDEISTAFKDRMTRDLCQPNLRWQVTNIGEETVISGFEVIAIGNSCSVPIPVTLQAGTVKNLSGSTTEQIGNDPVTLWVSLSGSTITYDLTDPISLNATPWLVTGKVESPGPVVFIGTQYHSAAPIRNANSCGYPWRAVLLASVGLLLMN
jgi:hypothetical protein